MANSVGVVYRAATGAVDPWTKDNLVNDETQSLIKAGGNQDTAASQAEQDVTDTLTTFTLGGDDKTGADPSQAKLSLPSGQAVSDTVKSAFNDDGSGCGITNLAGCYPSWAPYAILGLGVLVLLYVLGPYVTVAAAATRK